MTDKSSRLAATIVGFVVSLLLLTASGGVSTASEPSGLWSWPTQTPVRVVRGFDPPSKPWLAGHRGVDLAAGVGAPIYAPAAGTVVYAGKLVDRGVVSVLHEGGLRSTYEPVEPTVSAGERVNRGQQIAVLEAGHDADALHWGARYERNEYINPLRMLVGPSVLKPWD